MKERDGFARTGRFAVGLPTSRLSKSENWAPRRKRKAGFAKTKPHNEAGFSGLRERSSSLELVGCPKRLLQLGFGAIRTISRMRPSIWLRAICPSSRQGRTNVQNIEGRKSRLRRCRLPGEGLGRLVVASKDDRAPISGEPPRPAANDPDGTRATSQTLLILINIVFGVRIRKGDRSGLL